MLSHLHTWYHLISHGGSAAAVIGFILIVIVSFLPVLPIPLIAAAVGAVDPLPLVERHGFYAVLVTRLIPVFPSSVISTAGAVTGISKSQFVIATLIGKLPTMVVFTVAGSQLTTHLWSTMAWLTVYGLAVAGAVWWLQRALRSRDSGGHREEPEG